MLNLNSFMVGSENPKVLAAFYHEVFQKEPDMNDGDWSGWAVGDCFIGFGPHSEVHGKAKEPQRVMFSLETEEVKEEFERIKAIDGAEVIKEPYQMSDSWIATFADPDGNYFQLMTPWDAESTAN